MSLRAQITAASNLDTAVMLAKFVRSLKQADSMASRPQGYCLSTKKVKVLLNRRRFYG
jgi:hypothetical protein